LKYESKDFRGGVSYNTKLKSYFSLGNKKISRYIQEQL
jgi:hypothetical protein